VGLVEPAGSSCAQPWPPLTEAAPGAPTASASPQIAGTNVNLELSQEDF